MIRFSFCLLILISGACTTHVPVHSFLIGKLKYSAFTWHYNASKDTFDLYVANYLDIDTNGRYIGMKHDTFMDRAQFFYGTLNDTLCRQIDSVLADSRNSKSYLIPTDSAFIYDGLTYGFDYQKTDSTRKLIFFIPQVSPMKIRQLNSSLENIIAQGSRSKIDSFSFELYKVELQKKAIAAGIAIPKSVPPMVELKKNK